MHHQPPNLTTEAERLTPADIDVRHAYKLLERALNHVERGELEKGILSCRQSLRLAPQSFAAYSLLAMLLRRQGLLNEALVASGRACALESDNEFEKTRLAELHTAQANGQGAPLLRSGQWEEFQHEIKNEIHSFTTQRKAAAELTIKPHSDPKPDGPPSASAVVQPEPREGQGGRRAVEAVEEAGSALPALPRDQGRFSASGSTNPLRRLWIGGAVAATALLVLLAVWALQWTLRPAPNNLPVVQPPADSPVLAAQSTSPVAGSAIPLPAAGSASPAMGPTAVSARPAAQSPTAASIGGSDRSSRLPAPQANSAPAGARINAPDRDLTALQSTPPLTSNAQEPAPRPVFPARPSVSAPLPGQISPPSPPASPRGVTIAPTAPAKPSHDNDDSGPRFTAPQNTRKDNKDNEDAGPRFSNP